MERNITGTIKYIEPHSDVKVYLNYIGIPHDRMTFNCTQKNGFVMFDPNSGWSLYEIIDLMTKFAKSPSCLPNNSNLGFLKNPSVSMDNDAENCQKPDMNLCIMNQWFIRLIRIATYKTKDDSSIWFMDKGHLKSITREQLLAHNTIFMKRTMWNSAEEITVGDFINMYVSQQSVPIISPKILDTDEDELIVELFSKCTDKELQKNIYLKQSSNLTLRNRMLRVLPINDACQLLCL